jgi:hypothetical protein
MTHSLSQEIQINSRAECDVVFTTQQGSKHEKLGAVLMAEIALIEGDIP